MSDTPSPTPEPAPKPKLTLTPKAPAPAPAPVAETEAPAEAPIPAPPPPAPVAGVSNSNATPPSLVAASAKPGLAKGALKLQGTPHPANVQNDAPAFKSPMPAAADDQPSIAIVALSFIAAAAALAFAALLYLKNQYTTNDHVRRARTF